MKWSWVSFACRSALICHLLRSSNSWSGRSLVTAGLLGLLFVRHYALNNVTIKDCSWGRWSSRSRRVARRQSLSNGPPTARGLLHDPLLRQPEERALRDGESGSRERYNLSVAGLNSRQPRRGRKSARVCQPSVPRIRRCTGHVQARVIGLHPLQSSRGAGLCRQSRGFEPKPPRAAETEHSRLALKRQQSDDRHRVILLVFVIYLIGILLRFIFPGGLHLVVVLV